MLVRTLEDKFEELEAAARTKALAEGRTEGRAEGELIGSIRTLQRVLGRPISTEHELSAILKCLHRHKDDAETQPEMQQSGYIHNYENT